jgi:hypothetical protein
VTERPWEFESPLSHSPDRGVDNNVNPHENDGRLFELKLVNVS